MNLNPTFRKRQIKQLFVIAISLFAMTQFGYGRNTAQSDVELKCISYLDSSNAYIERNLDTALAYADSSYALIDQINTVSLKTRVLSNLGDVYGEIADMDKSLKFYLEAKKILNDELNKNPEDLQIALEEIDILIKIGVLNYHQGNFEKSLTQYEDALTKVESILNKASTEEIATRKVRLFNNIAGGYLNDSEYDTALAYYQNALEINKTLGNKRYEALMENNIGICYVEKGENDLANHHFLKALSLHKELDNKRGQAQTLNSMGKNQASKGNFILAQDYFTEALKLGREIGNRKSILISLESLSLVEDTLGFYKKSLHTYRQYKTLNDSIFSTESNTAMARLEDAFKRDKEKKQFEVEAHRQNAEHQLRELRNLKIGGVLLFLLLLAALFIVFMRAKIKNGKLQQQKLELEHENLELEQKTLIENLDFKERELTANALFLVKNNELISRITEKLLEAKDTFKQENQKIIQDIIIELRASQDTHLWDEFEAHFIQVHSDFYKNLQDQFPNLTANEKKLCAFLRLNMSTKDISAITYQSVNSITVARFRLRKKLNIEDENIHLVNFLMDL